MRSNIGMSLSGMFWLWRSLQCTGSGHAQNPFASRFILFQCILHAEVLVSVPRYRAVSGVNLLIVPVQASPDRVFSPRKQRWWPEVSLHINYDLTPFSRTWNSRHFFTRCPDKKHKCPKDIMCLGNSWRSCRTFRLKFATKLLLKVEILALSKFLKIPPSYVLLLWFCLVVPSFPWRASSTCAVVIQLCRFIIFFFNRAARGLARF